MRKIARPEILDIEPYIPGKPIEDVKREYGLEKVVKLASNENPLGPSPKAVEAAAKELASSNLYPDGYCFNLRKKLSEKYDTGMGNFIFGNGTDEVIGLLIWAFVGLGDEVISGHPSFVEYSRYTEMMGGKFTKVALDENFRFDLSAIRDSITDKTKLILICNPNNPTGTIVTKEETEKFIKEIPDDILIVFDEAYYEYAAPYKNYPNSLDYQKGGYRNIVTLRTFSKAFGLAGFRVGYGIADAEVVEMMEKVRMPFNVSSIAQAAAIGALEDEIHVKNTVELNEKGKEYLYAELKKLGIKYAETFSNFIFMEMPYSGKDVFEKLLKKGVIVRAMPGNYIRVTIGTMEENQLFIMELKELLIVN